MAKKKRADIGPDGSTPAPAEFVYTPKPKAKPKRSTGDFWEKYKHPNWQRKRLEIMERAGFACENCGESEKTLNVHHSYYERGLAPWEYPDDSLHCLCEPCHAIYGAAKLALNRQLGRLTLSQLDELIGFARGLEMEDRPDETLHVADNYEQLQGMMRVYLTLAVQNVIAADLAHGQTCHQMTFVAGSDEGSRKK